MKNDLKFNFSKAIESGDKELIKHFLKNGVNINSMIERGKNSCTPLQFAICAKQKIGIIKILIDNGADVNALTYDKKHTALSLVVLEERENIQDTKDLIELLLENGADINHGGELPPLHCTIARLAPPKYILTKGVDYSFFKNGDCLSIAEFLLSKGADIYAKDIYGNTFVHLAAMHDNKKVLEWILEYAPQININIKATDGATPLDRANRRGEWYHGWCKENIEILKTRAFYI